MDLRLAGTGGPAGWPLPGCRCASCGRARGAGITRGPAEILVDGVVRITALGAPCPAPTGYVVTRAGGGLDVTAPDGGRLLCAAGPGGVPLPPGGAAPYHAALLDLLGEPAQLGALRRRGLVTTTTVVAMIYIDHRLPSHAELARRGQLWGITIAADGDRVTVPARQARPWAGLPRPWRVLLLGGARSGKSREAEVRLAGEPDVTYVAATGPLRPGDTTWRDRVAAHRARRPSWWRTVESTDVARALRAAGASRGAVLIDSIGSWLTAVLDECGAFGRPPGDPAVESHLADRAAELLAAWQETTCHVIAVSEETGSGVIPSTSSGRIFRDELGRLNQSLAAQCEEAALVVAGRVLSLPG